MLEAVRPYEKSNSFVTVRRRDELPAVLHRIERSQARLNTSRLPDHVRALVSAACDELTDQTTLAPDDRFVLHDNVIHEIGHVSDDELPKYLFYRYRYEIYPRRKILDGFPPCLQVEPASICNYRCVFCYQTDPTFTAKVGGQMGLMSLDTFKRVVDEAAGQCEAITLASRGEPLICRDIEQMLQYAAGKFLALKINTNAWYLDDRKCHAILGAGVNTIVFSADAATEPTYSQLRVNGKLDRVFENVKRFRDIREKHFPRSKTITRVSGVQVPQSGALDEMERLWGDLVDQVAFVKYNPWENTYERPINGLGTPCSDLWRRMFVWWDGTVNPCDVDYKSTLAVGSVKNASLADLWQGEQYSRLRERHQASSRSECSPCNRCTLV